MSAISDLLNLCGKSPTYRIFLFSITPSMVENCGLTLEYSDQYRGGVWGYPAFDVTEVGPRELAVCIMSKSDVAGISIKPHEFGVHRMDEDEAV